MCTKIKEFFKRDWTPTEKALMVLSCVLIGVVNGFLLSPIKGGIHCGNDNGDRYLLDNDDPSAWDNWDDEESQVDAE